MSRRRKHKPALRVIPGRPEARHYVITAQTIVTVVDPAAVIREAQAEVDEWDRLAGGHPSPPVEDVVEAIHVLFAFQIPEVDGVAPAMCDGCGQDHATLADLEVEEVEPT